MLLLLSVMFGGFVIPKNQIPDYLVWLYWLTPMSWCVRSIMVNQYRSPEFEGCAFETVNYCERFHVKSVGKYFLALYDVLAAEGWVVYGIIYLVALTLLCAFGAAVALEYWRYESPVNPMIVRGKGAHNEKDDGEHYEVIDSPKSMLQLSSHQTSLSIIKAPREKHFVPVTLAFLDI